MILVTSWLKKQRSWSFSVIVVANPCDNLFAHLHLFAVHEVQLFFDLVKLASSLISARRRIETWRNSSGCRCASSRVDNRNEVTIAARVAVAARASAPEAVRSMQPA